MRNPTREEIDRVKREYSAGDRVMLVWMDEPNSPKIGTLGTVRCVDDIGTIHVDWDDGSGLGVVLGIDSCWKLPICPKCGKPYKGYPALSRRDHKTEICPDCGIAEAMEDYLSHN